MQFSERSPLLLGLVALGVMAAVTVFALAVQRADLSGGYEIVAEFADAGGLRAGDDVFVAGVRVGEVLGLEIAGDRIEARLQIEGAELPETTRAEVRLRTLVGRRGVELTTGRDFAELLGDGDVIPAARTSVATDVPEFGDVSEELLNEVDADALNTFLRAVTDVTRDQRQEVALLIEGGTRLTAVINEQEAEIRRLLRALRGVSETLAASDADLVAVIDDFGTVLDTLAQRRDDVRRLLRETNATSATAADLVADTRGQLDRVLHEVHADVEILTRQQVALAEALAYAPEGVGGFADVTHSGPRPVPYGKVLVTSLGPLGVDVLFGCGGVLDQQLDVLLGPDPRPCPDQTNRLFPRRDPDRQPTVLDQLPDGHTPSAGAPFGGVERHTIDELGRRLLPPGALEGAAP
ncbi:MAG TPA: MlaD family protein [Egibacteraceae bacterium]|nr:MlaD family protein [Egibacteraceae bacterium]